MKYILAVSLAVALLLPMSSEASYIREWKGDDRGSYSHHLKKYNKKDIYNKIKRHKEYYKKYKKYRKYKKHNKVPEPSTLGLIGAGLVGLGLARRRQQGRANS